VFKEVYALSKPLSFSSQIPLPGFSLSRFQQFNAVIKLVCILLTTLPSTHTSLSSCRLVEATLLRMRGLYSSALRPALPAPPASVADVTALVSSSLIGSDYRGTKHDGTSAGTKEKHISTHTNTSMLDMPSLLVPLSATLAATRAPYTENMVKYHAQDVSVYL